MAIKTVQAQINGTWHTLTLNTSTGKYEKTITAPTITSYNQNGHYYNVTVKATNDAGTSASVSGTTMTSLRLVVKEKVKPVITITSPSSGAYVTNNKQPVVFTVTDEANGSGVNLSTVVVKLDNTAVAAAQITHTAITNGYRFTYTPATALADGSHTVTVTASDYDGNAAAAKSTTFKVDTVPPTLNGTNQGAVTVGTGGAFSKQITLAEGSNTIVITAKDSAGKTSSVTRTVKLDTSVPQIKSATITPNPVDAGASMVISVVIA